MLLGRLELRGRSDSA